MDLLTVWVMLALMDDWHGQNIQSRDASQRETTTHTHTLGCILRAVRCVMWSALQWCAQTLKCTTLTLSANKTEWLWPNTVLSQRKISSFSSDHEMRTSLWNLPCFIGSKIWAPKKKKKIHLWKWLNTYIMKFFTI